MSSSTTTSATMASDENDMLMNVSAMEITEYRPDLVIVQDRSEKSSSGVWLHFGALKCDDFSDTRHVYCLHCFKQKKIKKYQKSTSTGNLSKHLKKQHRISLEQTYVVKKEQSTIRVAKANQSSDGTYHTNLNAAVSFFDDNINTTLDSDDPNSEEFLIHDINEILIQEVEKRPILYNSSLCQEKGQKHQIRRQLWNEIFESLNHLIPYEKLPKIWKNIRDRYYKIKRGMENNALMEIEARPRYRYYDLLRFLDNPTMEQTSKQGSISKSPCSTKSANIDSYVDEFIMNSTPQVYITNNDEVELSNDQEFDEDDLRLDSKRIKLSPGHNLSEIDVQYVDDAVHDTESYAQLDSSTGILTSMENARLAENSTTTSNMLLLTQAQDRIQQHQALQHEQLQQFESRIDLQQPQLSSNQPARAAGKNDEFGKFGDFIAEVMRNMTKVQSRTFQMKILELICECEGDQ